MTPPAETAATRLAPGRITRRSWTGLGIRSVLEEFEAGLQIGGGNEVGGSGGDDGGVEMGSAGGFDDDVQIAQLGDGLAVDGGPVGGGDDDLADDLKIVRLRPRPNACLKLVSKSAVMAIVCVPTPPKMANGTAAVTPAL